MKIDVPLQDQTKHETYGVDYKFQQKETHEYDQIYSWMWQLLKHEFKLPVLFDV